MGIWFDDIAAFYRPARAGWVSGATRCRALTAMMYKLIELPPKLRAMKSLDVEFSAFDLATGRVKEY